MPVRALLMMGWLPLFAVTALAADEPKGTEVKFDKLVSVTPANWHSVKPENNLRLMQFTLPKVGQETIDTEVVIFYFGEGYGGSLDENMIRWKKMFKPPEGKKIDDVVTKTELKVGEHKVTYVELHGTYLYKAKPMDPESEPRAEHRMVNVVFQCPKGPYFIRMVGPEKAVETHKKAFDEWVKNFK